MDDEILPGPTGVVRIPADVPLVVAEGFLLRTVSTRVVVEILGPDDGTPDALVIARLAFEPQAFTQFVRGLLAAHDDLI